MHLRTNSYIFSIQQ